MSESSTQGSSFLNGIQAKVSNIEIFQEDGRVGVKRDLEHSGMDDDPIGSPVAASVKGARENLQENQHDTDFDLYDAMMDLDPELSGAVNAIGQSASSYEVVSPADEPSERGQQAVEECAKLNDKLNGPQVSVDILRNLVKYGNDINNKLYNEDEGITGLQSLPINAMTIVDDKGDIVDTTTTEEEGSAFEILEQYKSEKNEMNSEELQEVFSRDGYVLNEDSETSSHSIIEPHDIVHFSIDSRSNWHTDRVGRETYGVWGKSRLECLKFTIQTKYNTLTNKVAMDDKLLAREIYYLDTTELFGDINDFDERKKQARAYANEIKEMIEDLGADERPILPDQVDVEVIGPEGKAIDQQPFLEQLNNAIAAALTFPMAGLGRGTTSVKAGEEISSLWAENNISNLRHAVIRGWEEIYRDHLKLLHPDWVENYEQASHIGEMRLDPDIEIPTHEYEPFKEEDMTEKARQIKLLHQTKTASRAERREIYGLPTDEESLTTADEEFAQPNEGGDNGNAPAGNSPDEASSADGGQKKKSEAEAQGESE